MLVYGFLKCLRKTITFTKNWSGKTISISMEIRPNWRYFNYPILDIHVDLSQNIELFLCRWDLHINRNDYPAIN